MSRLRVSLAGRWGPVLLAISFGFLSAPLVAASLVAASPGGDYAFADVRPLEWLDALLLAVFCTMTASIVGGSLGGTLVRLRPVPATLVAIGTAWPVGIGMLSITAAAMDIEIGIATSCYDSCTPSITQEPLSGFSTYLGSLLFSWTLVVPFAGLIWVAGWLGRRGQVVARLVVAIVASAVMNVFSIIAGGGVAFACLAVGVMAWATVLQQPTRQSANNPPAQAPVDIGAAPPDNPTGRSRPPCRPRSATDPSS